MPTFQISEPAPTATLIEEEEAGRRMARGKVAFIVSNTTALNRTASVRVVPGAQVDAGLFMIQGASPTVPTVANLDLPPRGAAMVTVAIAAPLGATARNGTFFLRAALDGDEDNDATDSRPIAFSVGAARASAKPEIRRPSLWVPIVAGIVVVLLVAASMTWILWPSQTMPRTQDLTELKTARQMVEYLDRNLAEIGSLTVAIDLKQCVVSGDLLQRRDGARTDGKVAIAVRFGAATGNACPEADPWQEIPPKLALLNNWHQRNPAVEAEIQPFSVDEILEYLDRRRDIIGTIRFRYDESTCNGLNRVEPQLDAAGNQATDEKGKQIYFAIFGSKNQLPCQIDDLYTRGRDALSTVNRWASSRGITSLDRPQ